MTFQDMAFICIDFSGKNAADLSDLGDGLLGCFCAAVTETCKYHQSVAKLTAGKD